MKHKIFPLVVIAIFSSCMKVKKKGEDPQIRPSGVSKVQEVTGRTFNEFSYDYQGNQIEFQFPASWPNNLVLKKVQMNKENLVQQLVIHLHDNHTWIDDLNSQNKVSYQFFQAEGAELKLLEEVEVMPPLNLDLVEDFNLAKTFSLNSKTKKILIQKLNLSNGTHLYLEDYSGLIQIDQLQSANGIIQTFPQGAKASNDVPGRPGGKVELLLNSAVGNLTIRMFGEAGGNGSPGAPPDEKIQGKAGQPGNPATYFEPATINPSLKLAYCQTPPGNGHDGGRGRQGYPGNAGANGGDSGFAKVELLNHSDFEIQSFYKAGQKGFGGPGGAGGLGGIGGPAGSIAAKIMATITYCEPAAAGATGGTGDQGHPGGEGQDGLANKSILFVGGVKSKFANEE